jgi:hypothetical protein
VEVVHARCAGMDISKTDAKVCVRIAGAGRRKTAGTVTTWGAMTGQILALRDHLAAGTGGAASGSPSRSTCSHVSALASSARIPVSRRSTT